MHTSLLRLFVDRGVIQARTEIDASYRGMDMGRDSLVRANGTFIVLSISEDDEGFRFTCASTIDGQRRVVPGTAILKIDGMEPDRLARNFDLAPDGQPLKVGKRRGRKPKNRPVPTPGTIPDLAALSAR